MISVVHEFCHSSTGNITSVSARRQREIRDSADGALIRKDRLYTPQLSRNALGTVFTEKVIVSPVPFATTTKESFSTLKSTPLRSMRLSLDSAAGQSEYLIRLKNPLLGPVRMQVWKTLGNWISALPRVSQKHEFRFQRYRRSQSGSPSDTASSFRMASSRVPYRVA